MIYVVLIVLAVLAVVAVVGLAVAHLASKVSWRRWVLVLVAIALPLLVVASAPAPDETPSPCKAANRLAGAGADAGDGGVWDEAEAAYTKLLISDSKATDCSTAGLVHIDTARCAAAGSVTEPNSISRARAMYNANLRAGRQTSKGRECALEGLNALTTGTAAPAVTVPPLSTTGLPGSKGNLAERFEAGGRRVAGDLLFFLDDDVDLGPTDGIVALVVAIAGMWILHLLLWKCAARPVSIADFVNATGDDKIQPAALTSQVRMRLARTGIEPPSAVPADQLTMRANALKALETSGIPQAGLVSQVIGAMLQLFRPPDAHDLTGTIRSATQSGDLAVDSQLTRGGPIAVETFVGESLDDIVDPLADHVYFEAVHRRAKCRIPERMRFVTARGHRLYQQAVRLDAAAQDLENADADS